MMRIAIQFVAACSMLAGVFAEPPLPPIVPGTEVPGVLGCGCVPSIRGRCFYSPDFDRTNRAYVTCFTNDTVSGINQLNLRFPDREGVFLGTINDCDYDGYGTFIAPTDVGNQCDHLGVPRETYVSFTCTPGQPATSLTTEGFVSPGVRSCVYFTEFSGDEYCTDPLIFQCRGQNTTTLNPTAAPTFEATEAFSFVSTGSDSVGRYWYSYFVEFGTTGFKIEQLRRRNGVLSHVIGEISVFGYTGQDGAEYPITNGDVCPGIGPRSGKIITNCDPAGISTTTVESTKCVYTITVNAPIFCPV